jgi:RNA polymerase sigma-70 factor (family 1)
MYNYIAISDQELGLLFKSGDHNAFTEIYNRYSGTLLLHACQRLQDEEEAKDVVHEIFFTLWNKRDELMIRSSLKAYLYTAVQNKVIDKIAHKKIKTAYARSLQQYLDKGDWITDELIRERELSILIDKEIAALPDKMRQVFEFSRNNSFSHREISSILNISEETVKKQVYNAVKILKTRLASFFILIIIIFFLFHLPQTSI